MEQICAFLREHKGWSLEQIESAKEDWRQAKNELLEDVAGVRIRTDPEGYLIWESFPELELLEKVKLLNDSSVGHTGARSLIWLDPETGKQLDLQTLPADSTCGLVVSGKRVFLHSQVLESTPLLAQTNVWVDTSLPDTRPHHLDLQILPERELLFVLHREAGQVHIFHLSERNKLATWQIRTPGNSLAMNLSFDRSGLKAYLTDNTTPQLWIADLATLEIKLWKSGLGVLGNLLAAPEPGCLYLTILKPHFNLIYFELDSMAARYSVEIRGEPLTERRLLAWDPFMADQDSDLLFYLAGREQSGQTLPVLNIIDANEVRTIKRTVVRSQALPMLLVSGPENPFLQVRDLDFKTWLSEQGLLQIAEDQLNLPAPPKPAVLPKTFRIYQPPADEPGIWEQVDQPAIFMELPAAAEEVIVDIICWAFYRLTLTNLRIHAGEIQALQKTAYRLRLELQNKQAVLVKLTGVLGRFDFQTPVSRNGVMQLLGQRGQDGMVRLEDLCPICQQPLEGDFCLECGFQLELPESERLTLQQSSAEPAARLLPGQLFLPHPHQPRLLTLNLWQQLLALHSSSDVKSLTDGVVLPNQHILAVDSAGNKFVEINPEGEVSWKARLALKRPVRCTYYEAGDSLHYLLVDQGNGRVLELDRMGKHHRRYPTLKTPATDKLTTPTDVHLTPSGTWLISDPGSQRVLEVDVRGLVVKSFGPEQGLISPLAARRKSDGSTEIYDSGRGSIWRYDAAGLCSEFVFWPPSLDSHPSAKAWQKSEAPQWACLIHNGEWLLRGEDYLMLVAPLQERIRWIGPLPDLSQDTGLLNVRFTTRSGADLRKQQWEENLQALRQIELLAREPEDQLAVLAKHVQSLHFDAQDWLLSPGELGNAIFFVLEGTLDVVAPQKDQAVIFQLGPGESCGTQSVLSLGDISWRPGIRVQNNCRLLMLERGEFKKAVVGFPRLFSLVRHLDHEHQRRFKQFREQKTIQAQDKLRIRLNESQIQKFDLFNGAEPEFIEALAESVHAIAYLPDQTVCYRGESGGSVFLILEGSVGLERRGESGAVLALGEGEIFGEMSIVLEAPRSATIRTLDYCKFFVLEEPALRGLGARFPWLWQRLEALAKKRQTANQTDWEHFAHLAGIDREDLPVLHLPYGSRNEDELFYVPSLHHDAILGLTMQGEVLWFWGRDSSRQLFQPARVHNLENSLLVADTGNDRILEIGLMRRNTVRKWSGNLKQPSAAALTPEGLLLVADTGNQRLVVMDESGREVWQYGLPEEIMKPVFVEITPSGTLLFADAGMHKVYELSLDGKILWSHGKWRNPGKGLDQLKEPGWVHRLGDGSTLIADTGNQRMIWLDAGKQPQVTSLQHLEAFRPEHCLQLKDGDWMLVDAVQDRVIRLNRRGEVIWEAYARYPDQSTHVHSEPETIPTETTWVIDERILSEPNPEPASDRIPDAFVLEKQLTAIDQKPSEILSMTETLAEPNLVWRELGLEISADRQPDETLPETELPEILPELDHLLDQVAEDLETISAQEAFQALSLIEQLEKADTSTTLVIKTPGQTEIVAFEGDEPEAGDKVDDFLDFLMSAPEE